MTDAIAVTGLVTSFGPARAPDGPNLSARTGPSAFSHVPKLPAESLNGLPLAVLTAMAAALIAAGSAGIRGRDLPIG
ncbi:hypothetical protein ACIBHY_47720 [Nonomuraea sp. NPDC050547]|uniref:hypothetical protein n=1 Tax=unclassified Nonomuraea TaxID=2593643 RepID=UPI0037920FF5